MGAAALGRQIASGAADPDAVARSFLQAIAAEDCDAWIYARTDPAGAEAEARAAAARRAAGARRGPLDGVPVSWKDVFDTAGRATEAGSALLAGRVPSRDAALVARGRRAGLVTLGKTHLSELAFAGLGYNPVTATPPNVIDPARVPGGSSSGAAVSVARGLAAAAMGTDTGGSVRVPAAWNGLVGLKPRPAALPMAGVVPLAPAFDSAGPITRCVEDAALVFAALGGGPAPDLRGAGVAGRRFGVLETVACEDLDPAIAAAFDAACARIEAAGGQLCRLRVPAVSEAVDLAAILYPGAAWAEWGDVIAAHPGAMFDRVRERFEAGAALSAAQWLGAWRRLEALRVAWAAAAGGVEAVLLPTTPGPPPRLADIAGDAEAYVAENLRALRNTRIANLLDLAALTQPAGAPFAGLSLMAAAPLPGQEARLLRLGAAVEAALEAGAA